MIAPGSLVTLLMPFEENYAYLVHPQDSPSNYECFPIGENDVGLVLEVRKDWVLILTTAGIGWTIRSRLFDLTLL